MGKASSLHSDLVLEFNACDRSHRESDSPDGPSSEPEPRWEPLKNMAKNIAYGPKNPEELLFQHRDKRNPSNHVGRHEQLLSDVSSGPAKLSSNAKCAYGIGLLPFHYYLRDSVPHFRVLLASVHTRIPPP